MSKFHITKARVAASCEAKVRACPLGGEHYDSMEDAAMAVLEAGMREQAFSNHKDPDDAEAALERMLGDVDRVTAYAADTDVQNFGERTEAYGKHYDEMRPELDLNPYSDPDTDNDALDNDLADLLALWDEEEELLSFQDDIEREMRGEVTAEEIAAEEEAVDLVRKARDETMELFRSMPTEWGTEFLERDISAAAAEELATYQGLKTLDVLAQDLEEQSRKDHADGKISDNELEEELQVVGALRFLMSPGAGRRHGPREQRPIDPNLIQALRCLYMKRFGVDPFEQGVTVPQLLQLRQSRQI